MYYILFKNSATLKTMDRCLSIVTNVVLENSQSEKNKIVPFQFGTLRQIWLIIIFAMELIKKQIFSYVLSWHKQNLLVISATLKNIGQTKSRVHFVAVFLAFSC